MVSIIIPAYNCERYIQQCLDSLIQQEEQNLEIIVVNDGSEDGTADILNYYSKNEDRLKVLNVKNGGPSRARNIGLDNANGDWVLFVDADDWVDTDILSSLDLNQNAADIIFFGFKRCYEDTRIVECIPESVGCECTADAVNRQLLSLFNSKAAFFGFTVNKIYKRSIIEQHHLRFREGLNVREDEAFILNYCLYITSVKTMAFAPYNYRMLQNSLSHSPALRFRNFRLLVETEKAVLKSYATSEFKSAVSARLFTYYLSSVVECISLNRPEKFDVISDAVDCYHANRAHISAPRWQKLIFGCTLKQISRLMVYVAFSLRNKKRI